MAALADAVGDACCKSNIRHKIELDLRPLWHQKQSRVEAHILVCFLAFVLWKTLAGMCRAAGLGSEPRKVFQDYNGKRFGVTRPVSDATGLRGFYSIPFPSGPEPGTNLRAVIGRLGLRLIPDQGKETRLNILHVDHLHTHCERGPDAARLGN
ncbi:MAG: hypothetical protein ACRD1M_09455 [Terriglobales bacterium]